MIIRSSSYRSGADLSPPPVPAWAQQSTAQPAVVINAAEQPPQMDAIPKHLHRAVQRLLGEVARTGVLTLEAFQNICERRGLTAEETVRIEAQLRARDIKIERPEVVSGWLPPEDDESGWDGSAFDVYMQDLSHYGLLFREDEVALGRQVRLARDLLPAVFATNELAADECEDRLKSLIKGATVDLEVPSDLREVVNAGSAAEEQLFCCNLRLVISVARKTYWQHKGMEPLDLIQGGNTGLSRAVIKFDHSLGYKFSTYATWWIKQAINRHVANTGRIIRVPVHVQDEIRYVKRARRELQRELQTEPTIHEIAEFAQLDPSKVAFLDEIERDCLSLDKPVRDGRSSLQDLHLGPDNVDAAIEQHANSELVNQILDGLDDRSATILRLRFGIGTDESKTLEQIGEMFGVTRERIRQLEKKALNRLAADPGVREACGRTHAMQEIEQVEDE